MVTIRCQNRFKDKKNGKCGRILGILTDMQIDMLGADDEKGPIFRCPQCPPEQRWSQVVRNKDGKLEFVTIDPPDVPEEVKFQELTICEQVG